MPFYTKKRTTKKLQALPAAALPDWVKGLGVGLLPPTTSAGVVVLEAETAPLTAVAARLREEGARGTNIL